MTPDQRKQAAIVATRRVLSEREVAFRPRCTDCRFGPVRDNNPDRCEHFVHWRISPERRLRIPMTTGEARSPEGLCGPEAMLFQRYRGWRRGAKMLARYRGEPADLVPLVCVVIGGISMLGSLIWYLL